MIKLPGLIDPHVHFHDRTNPQRKLGHGYLRRLAGGFTMVLAMPNTKPPIFDAELSMWH